ncbi:putative protein kinase C delta type -like protein [Halotydeus destructor]|nr:putative protein kinase C delta type -like protein [Halotydeus destructor]
MSADRVMTLLKSRTNVSISPSPMDRSSYSSSRYDRSTPSSSTYARASPVPSMSSNRYSSLGYITTWLDSPGPMMGLYKPEYLNDYQPAPSYRFNRSPTPSYISSYAPSPTFSSSTLRSSSRASEVQLRPRDMSRARTPRDYRYSDVPSLPMGVRVREASRARSAMDSQHHNRDSRYLESPVPSMARESPVPSKARESPVPPRIRDSSILPPARVSNGYLPSTTGTRTLLPMSRDYSTPNATRSSDVSIENSRRSSLRSRSNSVDRSDTASKPVERVYKYGEQAKSRTEAILTNGPSQGETTGLPPSTSSKSVERKSRYTSNIVTPTYPSSISKPKDVVNVSPGSSYKKSSPRNSITSVLKSPTMCQLSTFDFSKPRPTWHAPKFGTRTDSSSESKEKSGPAAEAEVEPQQEAELFACASLVVEPVVESVVEPVVAPVVEPVALVESFAKALFSEPLELSQAVAIANLDIKTRDKANRVETAWLTGSATTNKVHVLWCPAKSLPAFRKVEAPKTEPLAEHKSEPLLEAIAKELSEISKITSPTEPSLPALEKSESKSSILPAMVQAQLPEAIPEPVKVSLNATKLTRPELTKAELGKPDIVGFILKTSVSSPVISKPVVNATAKPFKLSVKSESFDQPARDASKAEPIWSKPALPSTSGTTSAIQSNGQNGEANADYSEPKPEIMRLNSLSDRRPSLEKFDSSQDEEKVEIVRLNSISSRRASLEKFDSSQDEQKPEIVRLNSLSSRRASLEKFDSSPQLKSPINGETFFTTPIFLRSKPPSPSLTFRPSFEFPTAKPSVPDLTDVPLKLSAHLAGLNEPMSKPEVSKEPKQPKVTKKPPLISSVKARSASKDTDEVPEVSNYEKRKPPLTIDTGSAPEPEAASAEPKKVLKSPKKPRTPKTPKLRTPKSSPRVSLTETTIEFEDTSAIRSTIVTNDDTNVVDECPRSAGHEPSKPVTWPTRLDERRASSLNSNSIESFRQQLSSTVSTVSDSKLDCSIVSYNSAPEETKEPKRIRFKKYHFADFNVLNVLGRGSFGKIFLCELREHNQLFAMKCMTKHTVVETDDVESTMIERRVMVNGTVHPFICKLFCTFQTPTHLCFVMEYLCGGDLMYHVQKYGKMSEDKARFYLAEAVCALKFLHKRAIIYRDLKLDNIVLDKDGHIRLVDFGMCQCKIYKEECLPSNFCGTPEYMAPEIIKGVKYNQLVDWWSFGVLIYEMVVGRPPFDGSDEDELLWNICNEEVHYPKYLSKDIVEMMSICMEKNPDQRMMASTCMAGDICYQTYFNPIQWPQVEKLKLNPPYKPEMKNPRDISNFDREFTDASPNLTPVDNGVTDKLDHEVFSGFSYTNPNMTD